MASELDYNQFLSELKKISINQLIEEKKKKKKSAEEIYEELNYDFPLISMEDIEILREKYEEYLEENTKIRSKFPLKRSFLNGIEYIASKCYGKVEETEEDEKNQWKTLPIFGLCRLVLVEHFLILLRENEEDLRESLQEYHLMDDHDEGKQDDSIDLKLGDILSFLRYEMVEDGNFWSPSSPQFILPSFFSICDLMDSHPFLPNLSMHSSHFLRLIELRMMKENSSLIYLLPLLLNYFENRGSNNSNNIELSILASLTSIQFRSKKNLYEFRRILEKKCTSFASVLKSFGDLEKLDQNSQNQLISILAISKYYVETKPDSEDNSEILSSGLFSEILRLFVMDSQRYRSEFEVLIAFCLQSQKATEEAKAFPGLLELLNRESYQINNVDDLVGWNLVFFLQNQKDSFLHSSASSLLKIVSSNWKGEQILSSSLLRSLRYVKLFVKTKTGNAVVKKQRILLKEVLEIVQKESQPIKSINQEDSSSMSASEEKHNSKIMIIRKMIKEILHDSKAE